MSFLEVLPRGGTGLETICPCSYSTQAAAAILCVGSCLAASGDGLLNKNHFRLLLVFLEFHCDVLWLGDTNGRRKLCDAPMWKLSRL